MDRDGNRARGQRLGMATLGGAILVVVYWVLYFSGVLADGANDAPVRSFESAFPLADTVLAVILFAASHALITGRPSGSFLLVWAAAMTLYLGLLDLFFYWQVGWYAPLGARGLIQLGINVLCVGGGAMGLRFGWLFWNGSVRISSQQTRLAA